eukprot:TRINITY_DN12895_c0_g1_i2.p1 TRINITY_DN12895_c0_g1~~TRINITY_DN12895_c0_g1_i2.p1  ORF type:complete len:243 (-),score=18.49 TRINITY_DN12895_c0_g1_i2:56-784(-)
MGNTCSGRRRLSSISEYGGVHSIRSLFSGVDSIPRPSPLDGATPDPSYLTIFCFGDSLTHGWFKGGYGEAPWAAQLAQTLHELRLERHGAAAGKKTSREIRAKALGMPGWTTKQLVDLVTMNKKKLFTTPSGGEPRNTRGNKADGDYFYPLESKGEQKQAKLVEEDYGSTGFVVPDIVIIMAGTNDIGFLPPSMSEAAVAGEIVGNLKKIHDFCRRHLVPSDASARGTLASRLCVCVCRGLR